jgi:hypothetical protein
MKTCWFVVIQANGAWWVDCEGRAYGPFGAKDQALQHAREIAVTYADPARRSDIWAPTSEGKLELIWSGPPPARQNATS